MSAPDQRSISQSTAVQIRKSVRLAVPLTEVWRLLSNTQRVNEAVGFPSIRFQPVEGRLGMRAETRFVGMPFVWEEMPFNWVEPRRFSVERVFQGSIVRTIVTGMQFVAQSNDQTHVDLFADITPRNWLGRLAARLVIGKQIVRQWLRLCRQIEHNYLSRADLLLTALTKPQVDDDRLLALAADLGRVTRIEPSLISRLVNRLREAPDDDVIGMRPFALADAWQTARLDTLRLFLHATRLGLLDM